jgi:hypothetical protein
VSAPKTTEYRSPPKLVKDVANSREDPLIEGVATISVAPLASPPPPFVSVAADQVVKLWIPSTSIALAGINVVPDEPPVPKHEGHASTPRTCGENEPKWNRSASLPLDAAPLLGVLDLAPVNVTAAPQPVKDGRMHGTTASHSTPKPFTSVPFCSYRSRARVNRLLVCSTVWHTTRVQRGSAQGFSAHLPDSQPMEFVPDFAASPGSRQGHNRPCNFRDAE